MTKMYLLANVPTASAATHSTVSDQKCVALASSAPDIAWATLAISTRGCRHAALWATPLDSALLVSA